MKPLVLSVCALALAGAAWVGGRRGVSAAAGNLWRVLLTAWLAEVGLTLWFTSVPVASAPEVVAHPCLPSPDGLCLRPDLAAGPSNRPTVLFVGDSFTAGSGVDDGDDLPSQVARRLAAAVGDARVLNHGIPGQSTFDELVTYGAVGASAAPDVVVWVFVLNDLGTNGAGQRDDLVVDRGAAGTGVWLWDLPRRLAEDRRVTAETEADYRAALADPDQLDALRGVLTGVADDLRARGGRLVFAVYPLLHALDAYPFAAAHARLVALAEDAGAEAVDLLPAFTGRDATALWVSRADHHPNAAAHGLAADLLAPRLLPVPSAGPPDCARVPAYPGLGDVTRTACAGGGLTGLVDALAAMTARGEVGALRPMNPGARARELGVVAAAARGP